MLTKKQETLDFLKQLSPVDQLKWLQEHLEPSKAHITAGLKKEVPSRAELESTLSSILIGIFNSVHDDEMNLITDSEQLFVNFQKNFKSVEMV